MKFLTNILFLHALCSDYPHDIENSSALTAMSFKGLSLFKTIQEYSEASTVHGISYVFSKSLSKVVQDLSKISIIDVVT